MSTSIETVYLGHDNVVSIIPYADVATRTNYIMDTVTEVTASADLVASVATGDDITASDADVPVTIWYDQDADGIWQIHLKVGLFVSMVAGAYKVRVVITDAVNTNGLVIADDLLVTVVDVP